MAKVLVIEDDVVMLKMYGRVFGYEGFEVVTANNGADGLKLAVSAKPNLILLDVMLPKMSGLQVLEQLKSQPTTQHIPVVVFSNLAGKQDQDTVLAKGAVRYIHKSEVTPKQVAEVVKEELTRLANGGQGGEVNKGSSASSSGSPGSSGGASPAS